MSKTQCIQTAILKITLILTNEYSTPKIIISIKDYKKGMVAFQ